MNIIYLKTRFSVGALARDFILEYFCVHVVGKTLLFTRNSLFCLKVGDYIGL
jgi:hypothetical protein